MKDDRWQMNKIVKIIKMCVVWWHETHPFLPYSYFKIDRYLSLSFIFTCYIAKLDK